MAIVKITELIPLEPIFENEVSLVVNGSSTQAVYTFESGATITITGKNLAVDSGDDSLLSGGTIKGVVFRDDDGLEDGVGNQMISVTKLNFAAADVGDVSSSELANTFYLSLLGGNDKFTGSFLGDDIQGMNGTDYIDGRNGNDTLFGGGGDDALMGGQGEDTFVINPVNKKDNDFIIDLDIDGNKTDTLDFQMDIQKIEPADGGKDTLITLENGGTVQLDKVSKAEFMDFWEH